MHRPFLGPLAAAMLLSAALLTAASAVAAPAGAPAGSPLTTPGGPPVGIGDTAPDFTLTDTDGQTHHLADYLQQGKIVVLEWFCPVCSACEAYYAPAADGSPSRMEGIIASIAGPDTVWLSINSTAADEPGGSLGENAAARGQWHMNAPLLLDPSGAVGQAFDAEYTPTVYVIAKDGTIAYEGAPDDSPVSADYPGINFVGRAVAQLRAGQDVSVFLTQPFGCPVDYAESESQATSAPQ